MNLVIVESPTKAKTIGRFLGADFTIRASMGHVVDLPKSKLAIDIEHDFKPLYEQVAEKKKIISELKTLVKSAKEIILATDPDREGEAIAFHVAQMLGDKKGEFKRIVFHEITKEAIENALKTPRKIDKNLVDAQTARRVLDRLVGYKLSPLLWKKVRRGLSAGRVQSVALRLIVEREREIEKFGKEKYWTIAAMLAKEKNTTEFELIEINGEKIEIQKTFDLYDGQYKITKTNIDSVKKAEDIVADLKTKTFNVSDVLRKETKRSPAAPYTTSTLQQDAARRLGINGKRTMGLAQKLYEEGYITYHRTDSITIGVVAVSAIINFVKKEYGERYVPEKPRFYSTKQKLAQEAHEAIRPTKAVISAAEVSQNLGAAYGKLYDLIWKRAVASQMSDALIESTTIMVGAEKYKLKANGSVLVFDGFLKVNPLGLSDNKLPKFEAGEKLDLINVLSSEHETLPPPRYNDASIIKTLEEKGIGRPSTYATIISTIESRSYIERGDPNGGNGRGFFPTAVGIAVSDFLVANFSDIDDIPFTASMEDELDNIANGGEKWEPMMKNFYTPFEKKLIAVEGAERVKIAVEETDEKCPDCSSPLIIRTGRFGKFLACSTFPKCKFTKAFIEKTDLKCPKDGGEIVIKKTRKGRRFYGCSNYPKCDFAAWKLEDIKKATA
ncbi:MAG: type I DNA topoisomerase [Bacteroidales bacterium]